MPTEEVVSCLLPRSVLCAHAQGLYWIPPHQHRELAAVLDDVAGAVAPVLGVSAHPGERSEVDLHLRLQPGLSAEQVQAVVRELSARLGDEQLVAERISSLRLVLDRKSVV